MLVSHESAMAGLLDPFIERLFANPGITHSELFHVLER
jgi:hypothetical protein